MLSHPPQCCPKQAVRIWPLQATKIKEAELYWLGLVQHTAFPSQLAARRGGQPLPSSSRVLTLQPAIDEDSLLRVFGQLHELDSPEELKQPVLLPDDHRFTRLLINATHVRLLHTGVQTTLVDLRSWFWILKGRRTVPNVLMSCLLCLRRRLHPESAPMAPLPRDRLAKTSPFNVVGVDFCGPLYSRTSSQSSTKLFIVVFSCAVTRAVHLELTSDLSTRTFLLAFQRFTSRRGIPSTVYSDNASTFQSCARQLRVLSTQEIKDHASSR